MRSLVIYGTIISLLACGKNRNDNNSDTSVESEQPRFVSVPADSIIPPNSFPFDEAGCKKIKAQPPIVSVANRHTQLLDYSPPITAGIPHIGTPGEGVYALPLIVASAGITVDAGAPEIIPAKDMAVKDQNPGSFRYFSKLQGLKHDKVRCSYQDSQGNLWFGTLGGGATKYDGHSFYHYTTKEGLRSDDILTICEDRRGQLWFGTRGGGATRFDGRNFTHFSFKNGLCGDVVYTILEDHSGNVWFATNAGACKYDGAVFTHFTSKQGLKGDVVYAIEEDHLGRIWLGTIGGGVSRFDGSRFYTYTTAEGLSSNEVTSIEEDQQGDLWFGTLGGGISRFDGQSFYHLGSKEGLSNDVLAIKEDRSGHVWFGTYGNGVLSIEGPNILHFTHAEGLSNDIVYNILEDRSGNSWFATDGGGVSRYDGRLFSHYTKKEGLNNEVITSILSDQSGNLWLGTYGGGVSRFDGKTFFHYTSAQGLSDDEVLSILQDRSGNIWIGTIGGGVNRFDGESFTHFTPQNGLSSNVVTCILQDRNGHIWFGTDGGGVTRFDGKTFNHYKRAQGMSSDKVLAMLEDRSGHLWFGTNGGGVTRWDGNTFEHLTSRHGLNSDVVNSLFEDDKGHIWLGTQGGGVVHFDGNEFTHFTQVDGLSSDFIFSIAQDTTMRDAVLWIGSRFGLNRTTASSLLISASQKNSLFEGGEDRISFTSYGYADGFLGIGCNRGAMLLTEDNTLWVGANDRLTALHINQLYEDSLAPNIQLTGLELFNEKIDWQDISERKDSSFILGNGVQVGHFSFDSLSRWHAIPIDLSLAHNNSNITFQFIGITMHQPDRVQYRYKLEGLDETWSALTERNDAPYGKIPPGTYTFKVKAMGSEGNWSPEYQYTFTVRPPWYLTWWAKTCWFLIPILGLLFYIRFRERSLIERQKQLEIKVEEATIEIRHQKEQVELQKEEVEEQKNLVDTKNKEILDSIEYAKHIQTAILPSMRYVHEVLENSFVLYLPKDIVAGDFYWLEVIDSMIYIAACDCTGHGVPGAMVSVVCNNALDRSVHEFSLTSPGAIFDKARALVVENFSKSVDDVKDGMDASLCKLDMDHQRVYWSGANNPLWIYRSASNTLEEIKADKQPIGKGYDFKPFTTHEVPVERGDILYLFTDGYSDQFGGAYNKKLTRAKFRELLLSIAKLPMEEQHEKLLSFHVEYKGKEEQVDDICVIGVRV